MRCVKENGAARDLSRIGLVILRLHGKTIADIFEPQQPGTQLLDRVSAPAKYRRRRRSYPGPLAETPNVCAGGRGGVEGSLHICIAVLDWTLLNVIFTYLRVDHVFSNSGFVRRVRRL